MQAHTHARTRRAARAAGRLARRRAVLLALALGLLAWAAPAATAAPAWQIYALANSTAAPGGTLDYRLELRNAGDTRLDGSVQPITFTGTLPAGLTVSAVTQVANVENLPFDCSSVVPGSQTFTCQSTALFPTQAQDGQGYYTTLTVQAAVAPSASGVLTSTFAVAGGDPSNPSASTVAPATITTAAPAFGIAVFDAQVTADAAGTPFTQAAGHPFEATTSIDFNTYRSADPLKDDLTPVEATKDVDVDLPPGFFGDPHGVGQCTLAQLANSSGQLSEPLCPVSSQVGTTLVWSNTLAFHQLLGPIPVFNMVPPPGAPAQLGFNVSGVVVTLDVNVRSATDYGLTAHLRNVSEGLALAGSSLTLWGVPADPVHDPERACPGRRAPWDTGQACTSGAALSAFLRNPTSCPAAGAGLPTTMTADSWVHPGAFVTRTIYSHLPDGYPFPPSDWGAQQGTTGCDSVPFNPGFRVTPDTTASGQPSGYAFDVTLPQSDDPSTLDQADLKKAVVTLPQGIHLSASSAQGLQSCSQDQMGLHSLADPRCPEASKIGTVSIATPALPNPLQGSVYLATPNDNPFGTLVALYLYARGSGVSIKLPARVDLDPLSGQLTTTVDDNPQAPFSDVHITLKGGPRAPLANPLACATYTTTAVLSPWSGNPPTSLSSPITISEDGNGAPCPAPRFSPGFAAGTESSKAGSSSPFHLQLTRTDADQELSELSLNMPAGLTGKIASVVLCGGADAARGTCPSGAKIGDVAVGAGAGPNPFYITDGGLYLTGPYKGAPFGLSVVVPAVAGPFNLGNVVVRQAIFIDKHTAALRVVSDPLPTILQGVTLGVRDVRVAIDKPGFFLNSTSCAEKTIAGQIDAVTGQRAAVSARYQAAECANLRFKPKMALAVGGKGHLHTGEPTPLSTSITMPARDANLRFVRVTLPRTINARLTVINDACTRAQFESDVGKCAHAQAGTATAVTPLLRDPLRGKVYFVRNGHPIPDLFIALRGQVDFDLIGRVTIPGGKRLATTFATAPDVPVKSFALHLFGDRKNGSVGAAANLCAAKSRKATAALDFIGQNGRVLQLDQRLAIHGCKKPKRKARRMPTRH